jgi:hypothetical protein
MTTKEKISAVFLDTEVFDKHSRDFECANMRRLVRLSANGDFQLLLTSVTVQEIRAHLDHDAKEAFSVLRKYRRASKLVKRILPDPQFVPEDEQAFRKSLRDEFDAFMAAACVQVVSAAHVSPEAILNDYFAGVAPFATGNKKNEFPDAFAIAAIRRWCETQDRVIFVVSGDGDWKAAFKNTQGIQYRSNIEALLEEFVSAEVVVAIREFLELNREVIERKIREEAMKLDYSVTDDLWNGELEDYSIASVNMDEFHVIEADNGTAQVSVFCAITVNADVSSDDSMSAWRDPDTKDMNCVWQLSGNVDSEFDAEVTITLSYTGKIPDSIELKKVEFDSKEICIDADENGLSKVEYEEGFESDYYEHE